MFVIELTHYDPVWRAVVITLAGEVDTADGRRFTEAVAALEPHADEIVIDLAAVTFFGAAGAPMRWWPAA